MWKKIGWKIKWLWHGLFYDTSVLGPNRCPPFPQKPPPPPPPPPPPRSPTKEEILTAKLLEKDF